MPKTQKTLEIKVIENEEVKTEDQPLTSTESPESSEEAPQEE